MIQVAQRTLEDLLASLDDVRGAPSAAGTLELIVRRPATEERELLEDAELDLEVGLVGDIWAVRPSSKTGAPNPEAQVTVMSARAAALVADGDDPDGWAQAGDQLYVDFDLSEANLPAGARLEIGNAVLEVTADPHLGCGKFIRRFGVDALKLVNSAEGRALGYEGSTRGSSSRARCAEGDAVRKV